jgi:hypothetical protein
VLARPTSAVGDDVDLLGRRPWVEHQGRSREALSVALPHDMVILYRSSDRSDDLDRCILPIVAKRDGDPDSLLPLQLLPGSVLSDCQAS